MIIAVAAEHANSSQPTGVEHYTRQLILALARIDSVNHYILYVRTVPHSWFFQLPTNFTVRHLYSCVAWTQIRLSLAILMDRPDALLVPSFSMPLIHPANTIVAIHDLAWLLFPETETRLQRWSLSFTHTLAQKFARHLIAVSKATKHDMVTHLGVSESRVRVIHHGFLQIENKPILRVVETPSPPLIVCLGTLQPRKNLCRLIDAFTQLKRDTFLPHLLVIAGRKGWKCDETIQRANESKDIIYLGYVEDRLALLRKASLLVQPSLYEGFGLAVLDAFAERVPVACSNCSSLPEIAGDAAEFFDPYSVASMVKAMSNVLTDESHAADLIKRGSNRLNQFSWDSCAESTLGLICSQ